jgi:hypothetical protein
MKKRFRKMAAQALPGKWTFFRKRLLQGQARFTLTRSDYK